MLNKFVAQTLLVAGTAIALEACTALPVKTDYNPNMSVANCHSYVFANEHVAQSDQQSAFGNPINAQRLREAIEANMAAKGIPLAADHKTAECVVGYAMGTRQVFNDYYGDFGIGWGWGGGWRRGGWGGGFGYDGPVAYDETRISIDLFDAKSRTPIWHASVSQSVADLTARTPYNASITPLPRYSPSSRWAERCPRVRGLRLRCEGLGHRPPYEGVVQRGQDQPHGQDQQEKSV